MMIRSKKRLLRLLDNKKSQGKVLNALKFNLKDIDSVGRVSRAYTNASDFRIRKRSLEKCSVTSSYCVG